MITFHTYVLHLSFLCISLNGCSSLAQLQRRMSKEECQRQIKLKRQNSHWRLSSGVYLWRLLDNGERGPLGIAQFSEAPERAICRRSEVSISGETSSTHRGVPIE